MQKLNYTLRTACFVVGVLLLLVATLDAVPSPRNTLSDVLQNTNSFEKCEQFLQSELGLMQPFYSDSLADDESHRLEILEMLARLGQNMIRDDLENSKRGLGFGMDRGFSGQQAAKHLMGLHAATWSGGPGRRRRSESDDMKRSSLGFGTDRGHSASQMARYMMGSEAANRIGKRGSDVSSSGEPEE